MGSVFFKVLNLRHCTCQFRNANNILYYHANVTHKIKIKTNDTLEKDISDSRPSFSFRIVVDNFYIFISLFLCSMSTSCLLHLSPAAKELLLFKRERNTCKNEKKRNGRTALRIFSMHFCVWSTKKYKWEKRKIEKINYNEMYVVLKCKTNELKEEKITERMWNKMRLNIK